jgi:hypothetical protein
MSALYVSVQLLLTENTLSLLPIHGKEKYETVLKVVMLFLLSMITKAIGDFHENAVSKSHTLLKAIEDFVPKIFKFLDQHS